jgi:hypothetical protein
MRVLLLSCAIALLLSVSTSAAVALTNGQRLARGLPILPPKFGRALPGYARTPVVTGTSNPISQVLALTNALAQERTRTRRPLRLRRESVENFTGSLFQPFQIDWSDPG